MPRSSTSSSIEASLRVLLLSLSVASVGWSAGTLPVFWSVEPVKEVAARILTGDRFKSKALREVLTSMETNSAPIVQRSDAQRVEALIRLRIVEEGLERRAPGESDNDVAAADDRLRSALALEPTSSFLWLMLYSLEIKRNGFDSSVIGFLEQSYAAGPFEAWIALPRNRLALAAFANLSAGVQMRVLAEFAGLVDGSFLEDAVTNLTGVGWQQRDRLLESLASTNSIPREAFAKALQREGLRVSVPGVEIEEGLWVR